MQELQGEIRGILEAEFDALSVCLGVRWHISTIYFVHSFLQDPAKPVQDGVISNACTVVDVIGEDVRCLPANFSIA